MSFANNALNGLCDKCALALISAAAFARAFNKLNILLQLNTYILLIYLLVSISGSRYR